ncbi:Ribosomal protein S5 domain 2-type fold,subgroup [Ostreococcus tauri]|uniref:Ribosomal protein S5 domain 2-type fold,subgroup n=1 Tax=Ostreococcus tauri TaxID=70448 RepID=A0A096P8N8_OSTTA|nr:Ribosomal protein S5 domain 2-type fold,subgroup [Ostreococcus tauri]CEG00397.1 Ribosomal protein S5 domain 2-type fold,subgroup [Ostreococcus tauri]|eukprot:XP_022840356.1 Ribosomal protein S5 domain 2-type fold,subgroup [Ostreococcus tauri]
MDARHRSIVAAPSTRARHARARESMGGEKYRDDVRGRRAAIARATFARAVRREASRGADGWDALDDVVDDDDGRAVGRGRARGRIDVIGGIADYSGSVVAQLATRAETRAEVTFAEATDGRGTTRATSVDGETGRVMRFEGGFMDVYDAKTFETTRTRTFFDGAAASARWAAYACGALGETFRAILADDDETLARTRAWIKEIAKTCDCEIRIESDVPQGKGVASSAAVEVAVARAACDYLVRSGAASMSNARFRAHVQMIPMYCHRAENDVVGAPCGFMDQYACFHSMVASPGNFVVIDCDLQKTTAPDGPETDYRFVQLPKSLRVWGIDSGVRHSNTGGSDYSHVRCATFMGKKQLVNEINARLNESIVSSAVSLCSVMSAHDWDRGSLGSPGSWSQHIDESMTGELFLARYAGHDDEPHTSVRADETYALRACVSHPLREHARVSEFVEILESWPSADDDEAEILQLGRRLGDLMFASHEGYDSVGLGSSATSQLLYCIRDADPNREHVFGAKITGGGAGGVVAVLGRDTPQAAAVIDRARAAYAASTDPSHQPAILHATHASDRA